MLSTLRKVGLTFVRSSTRYYRLFRKSKSKLLISNLCAGVSMFIAGDVFEQFVIERRERLDRARTLAMASWGLLYAGTAHMWYIFLSRHKLFGGNIHAQAAVFMICLAPFETLSFFYFIGYVEGESRQQIKNEISRKFLVTYLTDSAMYYPFLYMNMRFVPLHLRTAADLSYGLGYSIFLSYVKHHNIRIPILTLFEDNDDNVDNGVVDDEAVIVGKASVAT